MTDREQLIAIASALYGARWRRKTAAACAVDLQQVRRWEAGAEPKPMHMVVMRGLAEQKIEQLKGALDHGCEI
jgi:hypothetical protein